MPTRTYLEQRSPDQLSSVPTPTDDVSVLHVEECAPSLWRRLYQEVGAAYQWVDRLGWTDDEIRAYLDDPAISLWILSVDGGVAGYFELRKHPETGTPDFSVEIAYFGLLPAYLGRGLGKFLLSKAATRAWELEPSRVWLHTSTLDHQAALPNYLARGFSIFRTEEYQVSSAPLWIPGPDRVSRAAMTRFIREVERRWGVQLPDYEALWTFSVERPEAFWQTMWDFGGVIATTRGDRVVDDLSRMPGARFFPDARLNFAENMLRPSGHPEALVFHGEDRVRRAMTRDELRMEVARTASALRAAGVVSGDRIGGYLPNMPEAIVAALAAASIGAIWSSCSPDFGVQGVLDRFGQIEPVVLFSADGYFYGGKAHDSLEKLREIADRLPTVRRVVVVPYIGNSTISGAVTWQEFQRGHESAALEFASLPFNHPLYILYSSGTTGVPKCIVHGAGGTLIQHLKEHQLHCDIQEGDRVFYFTTCGWMMWNWLVSTLACGATLILYDGSPLHNDGRILFDLADETGMTLFGTSAKFIDAVQKAGLEPRRTHSLSTVRTMTSTGSPLVAESFDFVYERIKKDIHLASISGGTDIISCFVGGNPIGPVWRGEIQARALGMKVDVFDEAGRPVRGRKGELVCTMPFPSMPVGFWNDPDDRKYRAAYFERFPGVWCHGDYVELTEHGGVIIYGRSDAVLNPGGVRIGTAEIYRQVEQFDEVVESLVVGQRWDNDERVVLFVRLRDGLTLDEELARRIKEHIRRNTTPRHVPARIVQVGEIPRTRSGKIVELAVRDVIHDREVKNREALANPDALEQFRNLPELQT